MSPLHFSFHATALSTPLTATRETGNPILSNKMKTIGLHHYGVELLGHGELGTTAYEGELGGG